MTRGLRGTAQRSVETFLCLVTRAGRGLFICGDRHTFGKCPFLLQPACKEGGGNKETSMHAWPCSGNPSPSLHPFWGCAARVRAPASSTSLPPSIPQYSCVRGAPKGEMQVSEELVVTQPLAPHHPAARTARQNCEMQTG